MSTEKGGQVISFGSSLSGVLAIGEFCCNGVLLLLAQSGHSATAVECPLSEGKQTLLFDR
jgi:hypothetical protein